MAAFDLPAMVDHALAVSGQEQLYYVGHSQGSAMAFAELSTNKELSEKVSLLYPAEKAKVKLFLIIKITWENKLHCM